MATIRDIAKEADVAIGTVSRVMNGERKVAPATARKVKKAMKTLGYTPKEVRPGPKTRKRQGIHTKTRYC